MSLDSEQNLKNFDNNSEKLRNKVLYNPSALQLIPPKPHEHFNRRTVAFSLRLEFRKRKHSLQHFAEKQSKNLNEK